jgi:hypothetical protein
MSDSVLTEITMDTGFGDAQPQAGEATVVSLRGPIIRPGGRICIGRVGAPPRQEATSGRFFFWVPPDALVERTQLVTCESTIAGRSFTFYAIVDEVYRSSRKRSMGHEVDEADNDLAYEPPFTSEGYTWASATILRTSPAVLVAPRERSDVLLAGPEEAQIAYDADEIERKLPVGLIKNGGDQLAGPGYIDLDYLLGVNGGHLNVNGSAGRGTKSSFLLFMNWMLLREARRQQRERPSDRDRLRIVPIILNVKNFDLFYIDRPNCRYESTTHAKTWDDLGVKEPAPFRNVSYFAAQQQGNSLPVPTGRQQAVTAYSWSLCDIVQRGLFLYLFAEADANDANFGALALDIESWLTRERVANDGSVTREVRTDAEQPQTFQQLLTWIGKQLEKKEDNRALRSHHTATWKKLYRRLLKLLYESRGVLRREELDGRPLDLVHADTSDPLVVDLAALAGVPEMQRFVVATILRQLVEARTGTNAVQGLVYVVTLDELNRFAPRGARDPITQLVELVAAEMRSQGIILFGAQQQASKVSEKVIENAAIRVLGRSGGLELDSSTWRFLSESARLKAQSLELDEKLVIQDNFREPMHLRVPFPAWAMNRQEAASGPSSEAADDLSDIFHE